MGGEACADDGREYNSGLSSLSCLLEAMEGKTMKGYMTLTLTNDHLCSHTDGGKSTYVFHTTPIIIVPESIDLQPDAKALQGEANDVELNSN